MQFSRLDVNKFSNKSNTADRYAPADFFVGTPLRGELAFFHRRYITLDPATVLSSAVVAALVAALVSLRTNERKIHIKNVTQERAKWRSVIRSLADELVKATSDGDNQAIERLSAQLALNVNPFDSEDRALVKAVVQIATVANKDSQVSEVTDRISLLLKHDWERAKREARPWFFRGEVPRRVPYSEFRDANTPAQSSTQPQRQ